MPDHEERPPTALAHGAVKSGDIERVRRDVDQSDARVAHNKKTAAARRKRELRRQGRAPTRRRAVGLRLTARCAQPFKRRLLGSQAPERRELGAAASSTSGSAAARESAAAGLPGRLREPTRESRPTGCVVGGAQYHLPFAKPPKAIRPTSVTMSPTQKLHTIIRTMPTMTRMPPIPIPPVLPPVPRSAAINCPLDEVIPSRRRALVCAPGPKHPLTSPSEAPFPPATARSVRSVRPLL